MSELSTASTDKLMQDLRVVVADAEALLKATAGSAGEGATELRHKVQASLTQAAKNLKHVEEAAVEKAMPLAMRPMTMCMSTPGRPSAPRPALA